MNPNEVIAGSTYGEWTARYWQWLLSIPKEVNPYYDKTGKNAHQQQSGPVFFLANAPENSSVHRVVNKMCDVPKPRAMLCPVDTCLFTSIENPNLTTQQLRLKAIRQRAQVKMVAATINNEPMTSDLQEHRVDSPVFNIQLRANNILGIQVEPNQVVSTIGVSDGYWIMMKPPKKGDKLRFVSQGTYDDGEEQDIPFTTDVRYEMQLEDDNFPGTQDISVNVDKKIDRKKDQDQK
jgi:hypothetical protein